MKRIIGRTEQLHQLRNHLKSRRSEFIAVYGRRRVGKTFLIRKAFENQFTFQFTGVANVGMNIQLGQFHAGLIKRTTKMGYEPNRPKDWFEAFGQLIEYLEKFKGNEKKTIFLDELPWMDTRNSNFLSSLEHFWNSWASAREDIVLIVCGSAASWMLNNLIKNKGGLHNRITDRIKLVPFTLAEAEKLLIENGVAEDRYQTLLLYMVFGGIPFYLERITPGESAMQQINKLCFHPDAPFRLEYETIYASLFNKHERHLSVIEALATKGKGLTRNEIIKFSNLSDGGGLTRVLGELEESSFIRKYKTYSQREKLYQLIDLYSLFYHKFIKKSDENDKMSWINMIDTPAFYNWAGYGFEMVCLHHVPQIKQALGISGVQTTVSTWRSQKAQVDLVIDRKDHVINLCEMKFSIKPFSIDKKYAENLRNKITSFREITKTKKALFMTMITTYGTVDKKNWGLIQNSLEMDDLFTP